MNELRPTASPPGRGGPSFLCGNVPFRPDPIQLLIGSRLGFSFLIESDHAGLRRWNPKVFEKEWESVGRDYRRAVRNAK